MHILIIEIALTGHHSIYLEKITELYLEQEGVVTVVVSFKEKEHPVLTRLSEQFCERFNVILLNETDCLQAMQSKIGDVGREINAWRVFQKTCKTINANKKVALVLLPYADYCLNAIGLLGSPFGDIAWSGICMRPTFHFKACGVIAPTPAILHVKRLLFMRLLHIKTLKNLFTIDELLAGYIHDVQPTLADKLTYLPDPAEPALTFVTAELRQRYNIPKNAKVILIYGAIDERKGIFNLLDTLEACPELEDWHTLVVGRQSKSVREKFTTTRWHKLMQTNRIHVMDEFVSDIVEHHVLAMCDVVWVAYIGHYVMSGVIVRAGMYCKPVIACDEGLIGWYAQRKKVGVAICPNKSMKIEDALKLFGNAEMCKKIGANSYKIFSDNSWLKFNKTLINDCINNY